MLFEPSGERGCHRRSIENQSWFVQLRHVPFHSVLIPAPQDFELVDVSESLPTLIRRPGLQTWMPTTDRNLTFFDTYEEYIASLGGNKGVQRVGRSHWPPAEGVAEMHLERW